MLSVLSSGDSGDLTSKLSSYLFSLPSDLIRRSNRPRLFITTGFNANDKARTVTSRFEVPATSYQDATMKKRAKATDRTETEISRATDGPNRVPHKIVRQLQDIIGQGELNPGTFLPSE